MHGPDSLPSQAPLVLSQREVGAVRGIATEARIFLVRLSTAVGSWQASLTAWAERRTATGCGVVQVDEEREALAELPSTSVGRRASASGMCYIIFTSGSTGRPKGAVLQHGSAVNFLHFMNMCAHTGCW